MIGLNELTSIITRVFDDVKNEGNIQQQINCPRCQYREGLAEPDGKHNLEINLARHIFKCWKCEEPGFAGSLGYLIKRYGTRDDHEEYRNYVKIYGYEIEESDEEKQIQIVTLPKEFISFKDMIEVIPDHMEAYRYLTGDGKNERKISPDQIFKYNMGFCLEGKFKDRIILPSYDDLGDLNFFVARTFKENIKPKYLNPKSEKENIILNESNLNWDSTIYLVEGYFDLLSMPPNTTASLGKGLSIRLYKKIKEKKPNMVILYDPDAFNDMIGVYETIFHIYGEEYEHKVRFVALIGDDDIDKIRKNFGEERVKEILHTSRVIDIDDYFRPRNNDDYRFQYINEPTRRFGFGDLNTI